MKLLRPRSKFLLCICLTTLLFGCKKNVYDEKIAIIGGGASGLTAAYLLEKEGYRQVTVFEKEDSVGGVAHTVFVDGKAYDMSTMFVPGGSIAGDGIQPLLAEMIDVSQQELIPAVDFDTLDSETFQLTPLNEYLQEYEADVLAEQLIRGLTVMTQYAGCIAQQVDPVTCGILEADNLTETIHEWGVRNDLSALTRLIVFTADALGAGPSSYASASAALAGGLNWTPVEVTRILKYLGVGVEDLPEGTPPNIVSLLAANDGEGTQRWWFFKDGYQTFWKELVKRAGIKVKLSEPVVSLAMTTEGEDNVWMVETDENIYQFDRVIVATTPRAAMNFLPEGPRKDLLSTAIVRVPPNDVYLTTISGYENTGLPEQAAFWPEALGLGGTELIDPEVGSAVKPFFWQKRHVEDVAFVATYTLSAEITPEQSFAAVQQYGAGYGVTLNEQIDHKRFFFPPTPEDLLTWRATWPSYQGQDDLYFVGEAFTGSGVPAIAIGLTKFVAQYFTVEEE